MSDIEMSMEGRSFPNRGSAKNYIEQQEETEISFVKVGKNSKNLIISFASLRHFGFERKKSLVNLKYKRNDMDILFLRNFRGWYLGSLNGIGYNTIHTTAFLRKICNEYHKVVAIGDSMGGYGAMLYGSLLDFNSVIAISAQTDMEFVVSNLGNRKNWRFLNRKHQFEDRAWQKYSNLGYVLNDKTNYYVNYAAARRTYPEQIMHSDHHFNCVKNFSNLNTFEYKIPGMDMVEICLGDT